MRLAVVTFELDRRSPVLAWQARVVDELAARVEFVGVLTERVGTYEPPSNVAVAHLAPRPFGVPRRAGGWVLENLRLRGTLRRWAPDAVLVHMAHQWTYRLLPLYLGHRVPVLVWYAHGTVRPSLRLTHRVADRVLTSTPDGFRIPSPKRVVIGQGIDTELFRPLEPPESRDRIVYVGRISRRKRVTALVEVVAALHTSGHREITLELAGPVLTRHDRAYLGELQEVVDRFGLADAVSLRGPVAPADVVDLHRDAFVHLNLSETGSMDKTVMEALACGRPVVTGNEALAEVLATRPELLVRDPSPEVVAERVAAVQADAERYRPSDLHALVAGTHDLESYAVKLVDQLEAARRRART